MQRKDKYNKYYILIIIDPLIKIAPTIITIKGL